jgi:hypothetical protein
MTGASGFEGGKSMIASMNIVHLGNSVHAQQYLRLDKAFFPGIPDIDHVLYEGGERVRGEDVLAHIVEPYFDRSFGKFCSHRQTPPSLAVSEDAGIVRCEGGICVSFPVFRLYSEYGYTIYRDILERCIRDMLPDPYIKTDLPAISELTLRRSEEGMVLHMLNYVITRKAKIMETIEERFTVCEREVRIRTGRCPSEVIRLPERERVAYSFEDGYTRIPIEREEGYTGLFLRLPQD